MIDSPLSVWCYGTPEGSSERDEREAARLGTMRAASRTAAVFGSRIFQGGAFALPTSDIDVGWRGDADAALIAGQAWAIEHGLPPSAVRLVHCPASTHWYPQGYQYSAKTLFGPGIRLREANTVPALIRAWAIDALSRGGITTPLDLRDMVAENEAHVLRGPDSWAALVNSIQWAEARGLRIHW